MAIPIIDVGVSQTMRAGNVEVDVDRFPQLDGAAGAGGNGAVLWEWDGTLGQWEGSAAFATAGWTPTLTLVADADSPWGQRLRFGSAAGIGTGAAVWLATEPLSLPPDSARIVIEATILTPNPVVSYRGFCFAAAMDGPDLYGILDVNGAAGWQSRIDGGVLVTSGSTIGGNLLNQLDQEHMQHLEVHIRKPAGAPPRGLVGGQAWANQAIDGKTWRLGDPGWPGFPVGWEGLELPRFGLAIQASGGGTPPVDHDITELRVLSLGS